MKKFFIFILSASLLISCATMNNSEPDERISRLESEKHLMSKKLLAMERRNEVLDRENERYKDENRELKSANEELEADLQEKIRKCEDEISEYNKKFTAIKEQYELLDRETSGRIKELTENKEKMRARIEALENKLYEIEERTAESFEAEIKKADERKQELLKKIETLKSKKSEKDLIIKKLEVEISALTSTIKEMDELKNSMEKEIDRLQWELDSCMKPDGDPDEDK